MIIYLPWSTNEQQWFIISKGTAKILTAYNTVVNLYISGAIKMRNFIWFSCHVLKKQCDIEWTLLNSMNHFNCLYFNSRFNSACATSCAETSRQWRRTCHMMCCNAEIILAPPTRKRLSDHNRLSVWCWWAFVDCCWLLWFYFWWLFWWTIKNFIKLTAPSAEMLFLNKLNWYLKLQLCLIISINGHMSLIIGRRHSGYTFLCFHQTHLYSS